MNRMSWLLVVPLALVSVLSVPAGCVEFDTYIYDKTPHTGGAGGTGGGDGGGGNGGVGGTGGTPACTTKEDCPDNECRTGGSCNAGKCEWSMTIPAGQAVTTQVYGDCDQRVCDAAGQIGSMNDLSDQYDFGAACYQTGCDAWMNPQPAVDKQCTTKWNKDGKCDLNAKCIQCAVDGDCGGATCSPGGKCVPAHCGNGMQDVGNNESDIDCGGPCDACAVGAKCNANPDCEERVCAGSPKACAGPTCSDGVRNGDETDTDCGGGCANKCAEGKGCFLPSDCGTGLQCKGGICQP